MRTIILQIYYKNIELIRDCQLSLIDIKVGVQSNGIK